MTDKEIVQALECCLVDGCDICPCSGEASCVRAMADNALALINEQQVVIGHLTMDNRVLKEKRINLFERLEIVSKARADAIKEFAEKLKAKCMTAPVSFYENFYKVERVLLEYEIDEILEEMVGADDGRT